MNNTKRLGANFDSIFDSNGTMLDFEKNDVEDSSKKEIYPHVSINHLTSSIYQPRKDFDPAHLQELAESIKNHGVLQPIVVRKIDSELYEIIAGERRWRAAQLAGLKEVPIFIKEISNEEARAVALIENIQREDLNPIEEAIALQEMINEYHYTQEQLAKSIGKSRSAITNTLRLLNLENDVKELIMSNKLDMGHARTLLALEGNKQIEAANFIVERGLSVRQTEILVQNFDKNKQLSYEPICSTQKINEWKLYLSQKLHTRTNVQVGKNGKSRVVINFDSLDALEQFIEKINY